MACRGLSTRATAAARSQQDWRLNHREAERRLPQQLGGGRSPLRRLCFSDGGARSGLVTRQGGALLREVAKLDRCESDAVTLGALGCSTVERSHGCRSGHVHAPGGGSLCAAGPLRRLLGNGLHCRHAVTQCPDPDSYRRSARRT